MGIDMGIDTVLVLDFGGQYCHLIARRVRECSVYSEIIPCDVSADEINEWRKKVSVKGIILSGGPHSVFDLEAPQIDLKILDLGLPVLGLCYGHQLIANIKGGVVKPAQKREFGVASVVIDTPAGVLKGLNGLQRVWMSHSDTVYELPEGYEIMAHTESCPIAAFRHVEKPIYGLQWHPEVVHTENGMKMLSNFLFEICHCSPSWTMEDFIEKAVDETRTIINGRKGIVALSGGIDSSTVTAIAAKAIGKNLTAVFIDHNFLRENEVEYVKGIFNEFDINFIIVDSRVRFLEKLAGVIDPEEKRKAIGEEFIRVFEEEARRVQAEYLLQGTIYPDRIESGFRNFSEKIKTHHNVGGLPSKIEFREVVEPIRDLYKDEVRRLAKELELPHKIVKRQPFPGPGLAVRVMGEVTKEKLEILRKADKIVTDEIERSGLDESMWQYFAVLLNTKSTGVKGDSRVYGYTVAIRAVESREAMTASFTKIPYPTLEKISSRITNEVPKVTRVVYDITHKPPATIEWE